MVNRINEGNNTKMMNRVLPLGKLPPDLLARVLSKTPLFDERVLHGPGIGMDCAVVDAGKNLLVFKSEPITFVTNAIGWYAVQVSVNDIATTGATPRWMLLTLLLPENRTTPEMVGEIGDEVFEACRALEISVIGGHTEITHGLENPILVATLVGEVESEKLITPRGARPGDRVLLTKGVPIEATAILASEFPDRLRDFLTEEEITQAAGFLYNPGISVLRDAQIAAAAGGVTAMHDPTEGGLASALWEMAEASQTSIYFYPKNVYIPELSRRVCAAFALDPFSAIASGALLITAGEESCAGIIQALKSAGIVCYDIGSVETGEISVYSNKDGERVLLHRPERDEITRVYEQS
jgi:hydrogenase expression/formation protein HypE